MNYRNLLIIYILLIIKICKIYSRNFNLTVIAHTYMYDENSIYKVLVDGFNEYSIQNNLNIHLDLTILTPENSQSDFENYGTTIDSLLLKKSTKYDIYFYYAAYSKKYGEHFLNLREYLTEEFLNRFDKNLLDDMCSTNNKVLIGLPIYFDISTLFSNQELLTKYNKDIPKTWDELISTSKYIYEKEKELNNTIIRYNGLFNEYSGSVSFYEFINSFRESNGSPHPEITSKETIEALEKLKEIKNEIGEDIFKNSDFLEFEILTTTGKGLFINCLHMPSLPIFKKTALPGRKKGVSGSVVIPTNIAVSNYIDKARKKAAMEFMKFIASKETHKKYIISKYMFSSITEMYDDDEVCKEIECDMIKSIYPFSFVNNDVKLFGDDAYHIKYRERLFDYLYNDRPLLEVLKSIEDITKVYTFLFKMDNSNIGLIIFIVFLIFSISTVLSLSFIFIKKLKKKFIFLSRDLWVITTMGSLMIMCSIITLYSDVTDFKCHLRITLINVGFVLSICPPLYKLITNFPENNKISLWFEKNKYIFILIVMIFTMSLNGLFAISSYDIQDLTTSAEKNFKKCAMTNIFGNLIYYIMQVYTILIIVISLLLIYMEWSLEDTYLDINFLSTALFMDILSIILLNIIEKVKFKDYVLYNLLLATNILIFSGFNQLFIYFVRILPLFKTNSEVEESNKILKELLNSDLHGSKNFSYTTSNYNSESTDNSKSSKTTDKNKSIENSKLTKITQKIMYYHNQKNRTSISES